MARITCTLHVNPHTFMISRSLLLRMRNVLNKCVEQITHSMFNILFFENHAFYEIMFKNVVQPHRPQMTI
jgi:type IV secretory pathway VirB3-like protein